MGRFSNEMGTTTSCMDGEVECTLAFVMGLMPWERWRLEVGYLGIELKDFASKRTIILIRFHPVLGCLFPVHNIRVGYICQLDCKAVNTSFDEGSRRMRIKNGGAETVTNTRV